MSRPEAPLDQTLATRDFALTSKRGWRRGVDGRSIFVGGIMSLIPAMGFGIPIAVSVGTGVGIPVALGIAALAIVATEVGNRKNQAKVFKILFEKEGLPRQDGIANQIIAAMKPEINTDQFIGVINNLLERKEVSADLVGLVNKPQISDVQKRIRSHYIFGYEEEKMMLDDKAVLQFLLLNSVVGRLKNNPELLPQVDRETLYEKFGEFSGRFYEHCDGRYSEKMTTKCRGKIRALLEEYGYSDIQGGKVRDWVKGDDVAIEMAPIMGSRVAVDIVRHEAMGGGGGGGLAAARADRVEAMQKGEAEDGRSSR